MISTGGWLAGCGFVVSSLYQMWHPIHQTAWKCDMMDRSAAAADFRLKSTFTLIIRPRFASGSAGSDLQRIE